MGSKALIFAVAGIVLLCATNALTYVSTRASYKQAGIQTGEIDQKVQIIETLKKQKPIQSCKAFDAKGLVEVIAVKATSLYLVPSSSDEFKFCLLE